MRRLIAEGGITELGLQAVTGIGQAALRSFLYEDQSAIGLTSAPQALSGPEGGRLATLTVQLATFAVQLKEGMEISDDERLTAILEGLMMEGHLTTQNIARLTGIDVDDLEKALTDVESVPIESRYAIAIKVSYLVAAINNARR